MNIWPSASPSEPQQVTRPSTSQVVAPLLGPLGLVAKEKCTKEEQRPADAQCSATHASNGSAIWLIVNMCQFHADNLVCR